MSQTKHIKSNQKIMLSLTPMMLVMQRTPQLFFDFFRTYEEKGIKPVMNALCEDDDNLPKYCDREMNRYQ